MQNRVPLVFALVGVCLAPSMAQTKQSMFVFQNKFWLNLHQFLRGEVYRRGAKLPLGVDPTSLSETERAAWESAIEVYVDVAKGDLVYDEGARRIANALSMTGDEVRLPEGLLDTRTLAALNAAAPIYRARLWPARQRDNEAWNASTKALVERHQTAMVAALEKVYRVTWPSEPYLVDAVGEDGPASAVTHDGPPGFAAHIQASAGSTRNTGDAPLELILHESSHTEAVAGRIMTMIEEESARQKLSVADRLWHSIIMYTTGAVARRELADTGRPGYVPYVYRYDQLSPAERSAFERDWQPYLDGRVPFEQALHDLVRDAR